MTTSESLRRRLAADLMRDPSVAAGLVDMHPTVRRLDASVRRDQLFASTTSPGARFCGSPEFGRVPGANESINLSLLDGKDLAGRIRLNATVTGGEDFQAEEAPDVYLGINPSRVASLVRVVPGVNDRIHVGAEVSRTEAAAPKDYGVALDQGTVAFGSEFPKWSRIGSWISVDEGVLLDKGEAQRVLDQFVDQDVLRALDNQIVNGDGSGTNEGTQFDGLIHNTAIADQPKASESRWNAIVRAATTVRNADFTGAISVLLNPLDALALLTDEIDGIKDYDQDVADLLGIQFTLSSVAATGTAVVGDLANAVTVWVKGLGLDITQSQSHDGYFIEGRVAVRGTVRATMRIPRPSGIVRVTGF